ncbi:uncharacterized protein LOC131231246 [Magnolia sinica]|uniref:uncharacterized protein LOC131231246 n=1 Tax=Magnolia sinica TaxID=86752 RepID=UPI002657B03C|nr:uncharacterized protein LOC131231246 [Magnolia sinica]
MASERTRVSLRIALALFLLFVAFYVGRPLYWKLSATIHEIREKRQSVKQGLSQFVLDAQRSVGWFHDESDSGLPDDSTYSKPQSATNRRILRFLHVKLD